MTITKSISIYMNREEHLMKTFPLKDGTTYIQNLDKHMSKKKEDKGKLFHKLHQLQKRVTRWITNGYFDKAKEGQHREKELLEKIKGKPKK